LEKEYAELPNQDFRQEEYQLRSSASIALFQSLQSQTINKNFGGKIK